MSVPVSPTPEQRTCETCAAAPAGFADGLRLWHDSGHAHLDRTGVHPVSSSTPDEQAGTDGLTDEERREDAERFEAGAGATPGPESFAAARAALAVRGHDFGSVAVRTIRELGAELEQVRSELAEMKRASARPDQPGHGCACPQHDLNPYCPRHHKVYDRLRRSEAALVVARERLTAVTAICDREDTAYRDTRNQQAIGFDRGKRATIAAIRAALGSLPNTEEGRP